MRNSSLFRTAALALSAVAFPLGALAGCATTGSISGTVASADPAGFAADASTVQVTLVDAGGSVVASRSYAVEGRQAVAFRFSPNDRLEANGRYGLRARVISRTGAVLYQSADALPVTVPSTGALDVVVEPAPAGG